MSTFFERAGSRWYTIPAHRPFAEDLAKGLHETLAPLGPEALSQAIVLTPTRRGARALADAFVAAAGGRAVLPPQMRPLGDLDEGEPPFEPGDIALDLPAAIEPLRRRFELTRMVAEHARYVPGGLASPAAALEMADALGSFLDGLQIEGVAIGGRLAELVDVEQLADHWRTSRVFLEKTLEAWPERLRALGLVDVSERRVRLLERLAEHWEANPPQGVLVAAGSTGTAPATRALLKAVAAAPRGAVVLPGLDQNLAARAWAEVDVQHPQGALKRLLDGVRLQPSDVAVWPASEGADGRGHWRQRVLNEALRPPPETADWLGVIGELRRDKSFDPIAEGLRGLSLISARTEETAATVTALLLRETLETPDKTAALVTPDQALARRVIAKLARWGIAPDSSAGETLSGSPCGVLASLAARAAVDPLNPVTLLALLKHPSARLGASAELERLALSGPRARTWEELRVFAAEGRDNRTPPPPEVAERALALVARLEAVVGALAWTDPVDAVAAAARRTAEAMEAISRDEAGQLGALWAGHGGEAMARLLGALMDDAGGLPGVTPRQFADLLQRLMDGETIRSGGATHPRLRILGAIEARLVRADRLIVAGLEEGVWPAGPPQDPFLSRPMRKALDLPSPERRIGLSAHDFAQAACAPEVILLHTERREGQPTVKSRWLWRLETLARGAGVAIPGRQQVLAWARALDAPGRPDPAQRPAPRPPVAARPRELAVTRVESLTRDPYAVWARDILKLFQMRRPDELPDARERGTAIHKAFELFGAAYPADLPDDAADLFQTLYLQALHDAGMPQEALAREQALAREAARWVAAQERERRADGRRVHVELKGALAFEAPGGSFTVTARADRIEADPRGFGHILDYKTGTPPSQKQVDKGFSPQLTLTAAILAENGFTALPGLKPGDLTYLKVTGRKPAGTVEVRALAGPESQLAAALALEGLKRLIALYDDETRPYLSRTAPQFAKVKVSDYDHLARVFEWQTAADEDET